MDTTTEYPPAPCADCGIDANVAGALIVSTVIGSAVTEAICCTVSPACLAGFLTRAHGVLGAPIENHGHGYAEVFVDDTHFVKISPAFGPILTA